MEERFRPRFERKLFACFHCVLLFLFGQIFRTIGAQNIALDLTTANGYGWRASLANGSLAISGHVPGNVYTDLERAGVLSDGPLLYRLNDVNYRWVALNDWVYHLDFDVDDCFVTQPVFLVFHGVDTVADVILNGRHLGRTDNMFVRYRFYVLNVLQAQGNQLDVLFHSPVEVSRAMYEEHLTDYEVPPRCVPAEYQGECHANFLRKMQASFGWDWGPAFPGVGLCHIQVDTEERVFPETFALLNERLFRKAVSLEAYSAVSLRDVTVHVQRNETDWLLDMIMQCETPDMNREHVGSWTIQLISPRGKVVKHLSADGNLEGNSDREAQIRFQMQLATDEIEPWMPNGYGKQALYRINIDYWETDRSAFSKEIQIGFRTVQLVEDALETGGRTFYVAVNGVPIFLKGSNWIPADIFPERVTLEYARKLLTACRDANMNALRIWGGGIYEFDYLYQMADEMGIMIWQDFMFACSMYPTKRWFLETVASEVRQQVRRLQHHPSIILWSGNNENEAALRSNWYGTAERFDLFRQDYIELYVNTIRKIVQEEDPSRPFLVSSPTNGRESEDEGHIAKNPYSQLYGDTHYYNYYANAWNESSYPTPRMATEYGFQSLPSIQTWSLAADESNPDDFSLRGVLLKKRQHHPMGNFELKLQVNTKLGRPRTTSSEQEFLDMIYLTQMHQAQAIKTQTEHYRRYRYKLNEDGTGLTMAALYWQLNDIWQAPSWSSIEYGGRWKPLHHFARDFFAPMTFLLTMRPSDQSLAVYAHYDRQEDLIVGLLKVLIFRWDRMEPLLTVNVFIQEHVQASEPVWVGKLDDLLNTTNCSRRTCFVKTSFIDAGNSSSYVPDNYLFLTSFPKVKNLRKAKVEVGDVYSTDTSKWTVDVMLAADAIAAFVWLDTSSNIKGRFSMNGFLMTERCLTIQFYSESELINSEDFHAELKVRHLAQIIR